MDLQTDIAARKERWRRFIDKLERLRSCAPVQGGIHMHTTREKC